MVRDFLGRDEEFSAFSKWLNEEFEEQAVTASKRSGTSWIARIIESNMAQLHLLRP
jgi:hypothetical protein